MHHPKHEPATLAPREMASIRAALATWQLLSESATTDPELMAMAGGDDRLTWAEIDGLLARLDAGLIVARLPALPQPAGSKCRCGAPVEEHTYAAGVGWLCCGWGTFSDAGEAADATAGNADLRAAKQAFDASRGNMGAAFVAEEETSGSIAGADDRRALQTVGAWGRDLARAYASGVDGPFVGVRGLAQELVAVLGIDSEDAKTAAWRLMESSSVAFPPPPEGCCHGRPLSYRDVQTWRCAAHPRSRVEGQPQPDPNPGSAAGEYVYICWGYRAPGEI
jgi:hypothetical protein